MSSQELMKNYPPEEIHVLKLSSAGEEVEEG